MGGMQNKRQEPGKGREGQQRPQKPGQDGPVSTEPDIRPAAASVPRRWSGAARKTCSATSATTTSRHPTHAEPGRAVVT